MAAFSTGHRIVVGIDFGTTFSGLALAYSGNPEPPDEISVVKNWPGGGNTTSDKVPSELTYVNQATSTPRTVAKRNLFGAVVTGTLAAIPPSEKITWGYEVKPDQRPLRYLKLLLDPRQHLPYFVSKDRLHEQLRRLNKTPTEAVSHYLSLLHEHAKKEMVKRFTATMVESTTIDFVLTVPAVWSDTAKDATLNAAKNAGLGPNLYMISEPEAAAIYALKSMENYDLGAGDNFIICDAGGGTVDLISYEICSLSPLRMQECVPGTGGLCGGAFLNIRFENLVKNRMGSDLFEGLCKRKPRSWATALDYFENYVKRKFEPSNSTEDHDDNEFIVPLPGAGDCPEARIEDGFLTLSNADVKEIFRPIINHVIELIKNQRTLLSALGKTAKGVILVGGFGQSNHLFESLTTTFSDEDPPPLYSEVASALNSDSGFPRFIVRQPANAWTAVVRGAVLNGFESNLVVNRKARRHYGVICSEDYDQSIHSLGNKYMCPLTGMLMASNQISWHIRKGQNLPSGKPILLGFGLHSKSGEGDNVVDLIVSDEDEAPREFTPNRQTRVLCKITHDLQDVPRTRWKTIRATKTRVKHKRLEIEVGMKVESGGLHFDTRIGGIVYGIARADFE